MELARENIEMALQRKNIQTASIGFKVGETRDIGGKTGLKRGKTCGMDSKVGTLEEMLPGQAWCVRIRSIVRESVHAGAYEADRGIQMCCSGDIL